MAHISSPTSSPPRLARAAAVLVAVIAVAMAYSGSVPKTALAAARLPGPSTFAYGFTDFNEEQDSGLYALARRTGAQWFRTDAYWLGIAPVNRPKGFQAANPASRGYGWAGLDEQVRLAAAQHMHILLTIEDAPTWAEGPDRPSTATKGTWRPNPQALAAFAHALAERYSGHFPDPLHRGRKLPKVTTFQIWNEPNLEYHLAPQWTVNAHHAFVPASPAIYRQMLNAAYAAVKSVQPHATVLSAGTSTFGGDPGGAKMAPVTFLEQFLCVSAALRTHHGKQTFGRFRAEHCSDPAHLDALDQHPYAPTPSYSAGGTDVAVPNIVKLETVVAEARRFHRVLPAGPKPFWVTEFDWPTDPPITNPHLDNYTVSLATQARYLALSFYTFWRQGISHVLWYLVKDIPTYPGFGGGGVYYEDGHPKPAAAAFRFPFVAIPVGSGRVRVWGRAPHRGAVAVQRQIDGRWQTIATESTTAGGVLYGTVSAPSHAALRGSIRGVSSVPYVVR